MTHVVVDVNDAEAVACSRLRFDGAGSPTGSPTGEGLPLGARLLRLATEVHQ